MIWEKLRYPVVVVLIVLLLFGGYNAYQGFLFTLHDIRTQAGLYKRSPGCFPGATDVDASLPPCTNAPVTVVAVASHHEPSRKYSGGVTVHDLTIRDQGGEVHTYHRVWEDFAARRVPGETLTAQYWQGRVQNLSSGDSHYIVGDLSPHSRASVAAVSFWLVVVLGIVPLLLWIVIVFWEPRKRV